MELEYSVQQYAWGKIGESSAVASLAKAANEAFELNPDAPYAELWMGTHPNGPSKLAKSGQSLKEYLIERPEALGEATRKQFGDDLPFLFKVLSVNKALSIQAHPDKKLAELLHAQRPDLYKDGNHKPEMIIALTDFEALCDFRPVSVIRQHIGEIGQLAACIGDGWEEQDLGKWFTSLMKCDPEVVKAQLVNLQEEINNRAERSFLDNLFLRLHQEYPGDVGCFVIYFLSFHKLSPGEALFLEANVPHAYLSGDGMECMAASDNVVRSGLTPKYIDTETLCSMLTYDYPEIGDEGRKKVIPTSLGSSGLLYTPGVPDFTVCKFNIKAESTLSIPVRDGPSIFLVVKGKQGHFVAKRDGGEVVNEGDVRQGISLFLDAGDALEIASGEEDVEIFQAFC